MLLSFPGIVKQDPVLPGDKPLPPPPPRAKIAIFEDEEKSKVCDERSRSRMYHREVDPFCLVFWGRGGCVDMLKTHNEQKSIRPCGIELLRTRYLHIPLPRSFSTLFCLILLL